MTRALFGDREHARHRTGAGIPAKRIRGFTLVELMVVVVIIAILAAIGYPAYQDQTRKSRRADAKAALLELVQFMERNFTVTGRYDVDAGGAAIALPFTEAPKAGAGTKFYDLRFQAGTLSATTFTLEAVPKNGQQNDTLCGQLSVTQAGQKAETGSGALADCW